MIIEFITSVINDKAVIEKLEDGSFYGEIKEFEGVWAEGETYEACEKELQEVLDEWLVIKLKRNEFVPPTSKHDLNAIAA